jgi:hypothetical protein
MPLETSPSYISLAAGDVATGGGWADLDGDGWLDMVVANGNDISRQRIKIYHNNGDGTFPATATWSSGDVDYHGHLDLGDVNGDGLVDLAVGVYLGTTGFDAPGKAKVYLNDGAGAFSSTPDWVSGESFYCFSVAFGDADGDGDLDLAAVAGESYFGPPEFPRVFYNEGGVLESIASWKADELVYALDVSWGDVELDGDLDLLYCGISNESRLYVNGQTTGGGLSTVDAWENFDGPQYGNTSAFGDWDGDGYPELAVADNDQLGGDGFFKVYGNFGGALTTVPTWNSSTGGFGSHVSWVDLDVDGDLDLGAGRWFGRSFIYENTGGGLAASPDWQSTATSVVENMFWGDVDNDGLRDDGVSVAFGDGARTFMKLGHAPVRAITEVRVDAVVLDASAYAVHAAQGWISLAAPPAMGAEIQVSYAYSVDLDLGVTNWDSNIGNYVYTNATTVDVPDIVAAVADLTARPNPMRSRTVLRFHGEGATTATLDIFDAGGRRVRVLHRGALSGGLRTWEWDGRAETGARVTAGVYFARFSADGLVRRVKVVVM